MRIAVTRRTLPDETVSQPQCPRPARRVRRFGRWVGLAWCVGILTLPALTQAQYASPGSDLGVLDPSGFEISAGVEGRAETDIDGGGDVEELRLPVHLGYTADLTNTWRLGVTVNYLYDKFDFANSGFGDQWEHIHIVHLVLPVTYRVNNRWSLLASPMVSVGAESGAPLGDSFAGGGFGGFIYTASSKFRIGLGLGATTQIADGPQLLVLPILYWEITPKLIAQTENDVSRGYGGTLLYRLFSSWHFKGGLSFQKNRFRLDSSDRIGETESTTMWGSVIFAPSKHFNVEWYAGMGLQGYYRLEDSSGDKIRDRYLDDAQPFLGMLLNGSF